MKNLNVEVSDDLYSHLLAIKKASNLANAKVSISSLVRLALMRQFNYDGVHFRVKKIDPTEQKMIATCVKEREQ